MLRAPHGGTYRRNKKQVKNLELDGCVPFKVPDDGDDLKITDVDYDKKIETDRGDCAYDSSSATQVTRSVQRLCFDIK